MPFHRQLNILIVSIALLAMNPAVKSQSIHFSDIHESLFKSNPSVITSIEKLAFQLTYRNQWPGNSDFITYDGAFFFTSEPLKSSLGLYLYRDTQGGGIINLTGVSILYGYRTRVSRDWYLSAGLSASYSQYQTHFGNLQFENGIPGVLLDESYFYFDFSTGMELQYRDQSWFGLSVINMGALLPSQEYNQKLGLSLSYHSRYALTGRQRDEINIEPLFCTTINRDYNELLYGSRIYYKSLYAGVYVRQNLRFQYDAAIILLGTRFGNITFIYTYDINLSGLNSNFTNLAAHEVTFLYDMEYNRKSKKRGAIKCPKI
jgi:type IX secretion system PorP/SprF family membrane protein